MGGGQDNIPVFDRADFFERVEGDMELAGQIVELFFEDAAENMEKIKRAMDRQDLPEVSRAAHSLKGASANLSGLRVRQIAADLEEAAKKGELKKAQSILAVLEEALARFQKTLQDQVLSSEGG